MLSLSTDMVGSTPSQEGALGGQPLARLRTINPYELQNGSAAESEKLLAAAIHDGFFYLDLTHKSYSRFLSTVDEIYALSKALFDMEDQNKALFDIDKLSKMKLNGYKPIGRNVGGTKGQRDGFESYALPYNGILSLTTEPFAHPPVVASHMMILGNFLEACNAIAQLLFASLSTSLSLPQAQRFECFHRPDQPSPSLLRLLKYHAQPEPTSIVPQAPHTDLGSLTFLFAASPGLQTLAANRLDSGSIVPDAQWTYVEPRPGYAIVNLGDAMTMLTNGLFKSSLHRVAPLPDRAMEERYSFAYLMRPESGTLMKGLESPLIGKTAGAGAQGKGSQMMCEEWIETKFRALRGGMKGEDVKEELVRTGRREGLKA